MCMSCHRRFEPNEFAAAYIGWGYATNNLILLLSRLLYGTVVDGAQVAYDLIHVRELHEALIKGESAATSLGFDTKTIVNGQLYTAWQERAVTVPILVERTPAQVIEMLDGFNDLSAPELKWLQAYLDEVSELLQRLSY